MKYIKMYILSALFIQTIGALLYFKTSLNTNVIQILYLSTKTILILLPLPYLYHTYRSPHSIDKKIYKKRRVSIIFGILSGICIGGLILSMGTFFHTYLTSFSPLILQKVTDTGILPYYIPFALAMSIFHAGLEEYYWRWFAFGLLQNNVSVISSIILTNIAFSLHHVIILSEFVPFYVALFGALAVMMGGIIWSLIYTRTHSLLGSWISHILVDMSIMFIGYTLIF